MVQFETEVLDIIPRTPGVKSFRFKLQEGAGFEAGQFFFVGININGQERTKHFSFSNSPTEKGYIEFTKRITGSEFSNGLERLKKASWAKIKMPYGSFTLKPEHKKIGFICGGIGITPIRSMCKFATDTGFSTDIALLYGNNRQEDIIFRQDLDSMQKANGNIRIAYTLTSPDIDKAEWKGRTGFIDDKMIKEEVQDYEQRVFYLCGPPGMVTALTATLKDRLSVPESRILTENFIGY